MIDPMLRSRRVVLTNGVDRDEIDDLAHRVGWRLSNVIAANPQLPAQVIFSTTEAQTFIFMVEDARLDAVYLMAAGPGHEEAESQCRQLPHVDRETLDAMLAPTASKAIRCRGLGLLVLVADNEPRTDDLNVITQAMQDPDEQLRRSALTACSYAPWGALTIALRQMAEHDASGSLRDGAQQILAARGEG
jgi:hypothetical protein